MKKNITRNAFYQRLCSMRPSKITERLLELASEDPSFAAHFLREDIPPNIKVLKKDLLEELDHELSKVMDNPYVDSPNFCECEHIAQQLLDAGEYDALVGIAETFPRRCGEMFESSPYLEWMDTDPILKIFLKALECSPSRNETEKLLWLVGQCRSDDYGITGPYSDYLRNLDSSSNWLDALPQLYSSVQTHDEWTELALTNCGDNAEDIRRGYTSRCIEQGRYRFPIQDLIRRERHDEALSLIDKALLDPKCQIGKIDLISFRHSIFMTLKDRDGILLALAEGFVLRPRVDKYAECLSCAGIKIRPSVRTCLVDYLIKGILPWENPSWIGNRTSSSIVAEVPFPKAYELVSIALHEKNPDMACTWYQEDHWMSPQRMDSVAELLKKQYPERSISLWSTAVESILKRKKPKEYAQACDYLKKVKSILPPREWDRYADNVLSKFGSLRNFVALFLPFADSSTK